jgi:hypothetical protein
MIPNSRLFTDDLPLLKKARDLGDMIEALPASEQATRLSVAASDVSHGLQGVVFKIREAFPDIVPSGDHDLIDELIGLLRVTRIQRDDAQTLHMQTRAKLRAVTEQP